MTSAEQVIKVEKYNSISAYEQRMAQIITAQILEKPELSPWMILVPIVFIPFIQRYQKYKELCKAFSGGFLYTKKIALDIAYEVYKNGLPKENLPDLIIKSVEKHPNAVPEVLNIYQKQIQEIKLLSEHYLGLLEMEKTQYGEMVISYYQNEHNYLGFINKLTEAEKEVNRATSRTFKDGAGEAPEIMGKMEKLLLECRLDEAKKIFGS